MPGTPDAVVNTPGVSVHAGGMTQDSSSCAWYSVQTVLHTSGAIGNEDTYPGNGFLPQGSELGVWPLHPPHAAPLHPCLVAGDQADFG